MKKSLILVVIIVVILGLVLGIGLLKKDKKEVKKEEVKNEDAIKFKNEYESLNGKKVASGDHNYRTIIIDLDNPFIYQTAEDISERLDKEETFVVYFGFDSCPWCRSVLPTLVKVAKDLNVDKIYYVSVKDIRDTKEVKENGEIETTKEGSEGYYELIDKMANVLADYTLTDSEDNEVKTDEKRIFAPNLVFVEKGEAKKLTEGISEEQNDGYMELTDDMINDTYKQFEDVLKSYKEADSLCETKQGC